MMVTMAKLQQYYAQEVHYAEVGMQNEPDRITRSDIAWYATQRCLGASQFAQMCGVKYAEIEPRFEAVRTQLQEMVNREI